MHNMPSFLRDCAIGYLFGVFFSVIVFYPCHKQRVHINGMVWLLFLSSMCSCTTNSPRSLTLLLAPLLPLKRSSTAVPLLWNPGKIRAHGHHHPAKASKENKSVRFKDHEHVRAWTHTVDVRYNMNESLILKFIKLKTAWV